MRRPTRPLSSTLALVFLLAITPTCLAVNRPITPPDFTSDAYWNSHAIFVVHVTSIDKSRNPDSRMRYQIVARLSQSPEDKPDGVPLSYLRFWPHGSEPKADDYCLLLEATTGRAEPALARKVDAPQNDALVGGLTVIATLRNHASPETIEAAAFAPDDLVAQYALRRLVEDAAAKATPHKVAAMRTQADDMKRSAACRILSYRAAAKLADEPDASPTEYRWLQAAMSQTQATDATELKPFVDRILSFNGHRPEAAAFLTTLAKNHDASMAARTAAYDAFADRRLFDFRNPDEPSQLVFTTCLELLADSQPAVRSGSAQIVYDIVHDLDDGAKAPFKAEACRALLNALQNEKDPAIKKSLGSFYEGIGPRG